MRSAYRVLAFLIAGLVTLQASFIALNTYGMFKWVDDGSSLTKSVLEGDWEWDGAIGAMLHGIVGMTVIPLLALILLIVSFFAKVAGGVKWAAFLFLAVVVQVVIGIVAFSIPYVGALHGLNAFLIFGLAVMAAMRSNQTAVATEPHGAEQRTHV
jgi:heme A synthase